MTRSAGRLGRLGGALLALMMTLLLIPVFSGEALADTFTADLLTDAPDTNPGNGKCDTVSETEGQQCTLRAAVQEANALDGRDTIVLIEGTYLLTEPNEDRNGDTIPDSEGQAKTGDLDVTGDAVIKGVSTSSTTVQGQAADRIFHVKRNTRVNVSNLTITGGDAGNGVTPTGSNSGRGGGVVNAGNLTLRSVAVTQNQANFGGGIDNLGILSLERATVSENTAAFGGGIYNEGPLTVKGSTITGNTARRGTSDIGGDGGGLYNNTARAQLTNSTIASNTAEVRGGGVANEFGDVMLNNVTVNENNALGEGVSIANDNSRTYLSNTIVAKGAIALGENCVGERTISRGNNLSDDGSCNLSQESDQENTEPLLTPIPDDDEPNALIFEPQPDSPAIDKAANRTCPPVDQRGVKRPQDGNGDGSSICDVGSVEARPPGSGV